MSQNEILSQALELSKDDRERIALEILDSIDAEQTPSERVAWANEWAETINARLVEVKAGRVGGVPAQDAMAMLKESVESYRRD